MKFVDANVFLRYVVEARTAEDERMQERSGAFFDTVEAGDLEATTTDVVLHEVFYILCSKREYGMNHQDAVRAMSPLLAMRSLHLPQRRLILRAVELFAAHDFLDFSDALSISYCEAEGHDLVSFDRGISRVPGVVRSEP